ncbi:glyoxysomal processing protease, glyoxysomal isoform X1 [Quercus robur]|uniref:glyoxysomal processing protease, glyoxysomal isoform X1 n=1 Tax=Quercus robur TaxID=38942 RepID=UPI002163F68A|nr:glyoxysomal processing protease, glyoxysomal isoform X1 [Quercus robur]
MALPDVVEFARNFAVMVRVQGPDPKGMKMRKHAFHQYHSGKTTLSASGMLLPDTLYDGEVAKGLYGQDNQCPVLVVTVASVVEPFLSLQHRQNIAKGPPELISGVEIDVMVEGKMGSEDLDEGAPRWIGAKILTLADIPASALALQSITEASSGSPENGWEVGWSLASHGNGPQPIMDAIQKERDAKSFLERQSHLTVGESGNFSLLGKSTTRIAILGVSLLPKDVPNIVISPLNKRGDFLLALGSPFGVLSPLHFFNSISVGSIANCYPPNSLNRSLLMADIRGLPGIEGGPVFGEHAHLIGIFIKPLRQKASGAEVQLVIPWEAMATACCDLLRKDPQNAEKGPGYKEGNFNAVGKAFLSDGKDLDGTFRYLHKHLDSYYPSQLAVEQAMGAICLVTCDDGVWASGVLLNNQGLILTNAHLLEPWRFGKTTVRGVRYGSQSEDLSFLTEESASLVQNRVEGNQKIQSLLPKSLKTVNTFLSNEFSGYKMNSSYRGHRNIRVRLDHRQPWVWCDAKVLYVCKGPLDVALLQLEYVPDQLSPIIVDFECPSLGSKAYVIGHGLFGPRCGFFPSVCSGVVAKVVKATMPNSYSFSQEGDTQGQFPVMLETTAAVHPGGSGGAVVNSDGHMIGLVTSNARHGGGTVIPHLNFSIPCAALAPIFKFSEDMQDLSLLRILDQPNEHLSSVWALMPPLSPKPPPLPNLPQSLLEDNNKEGKGSRFAKFMAERQELLKKSIQLRKMERLSNEIIPSKL